MQNPTPTRQELSSYFFDRCTPEISNKVERWFFKNGNSQEAKKLLFSLWEELEDTTSSTSPEEIQAAFEQFKASLKNQTCFSGYNVLRQSSFSL